jgi:elongation factor P
MSNITTSGFRKGIFIVFKDEPHQILEYQHVNPGKGSAFVRTKLKSLASGRVQEFTYKSGESVQEVPVETHEMQYLYPESAGFVFMDNRTYNMVTIPKSFLEDFSPYLKPNDTYQVLIHNEEAVGVRIPKKVRLRVVEAESAVAGNTASGNASKLVTLETGAKVLVPLFIKEGEMIAVDPQTGTYVERA